jgi:hypothetical protein
VHPVETVSIGQHYRVARKRFDVAGGVAFGGMAPSGPLYFRKRQPRLRHRNALAHRKPEPIVPESSTHMDQNA